MASLKLYYQSNHTEAGCDEAGRGCLAGPVCAAAVILPRDLNKNLLKDLNDSKKLKESTRYELRPIIEKVAISFSVAMIDQTKIDEINILNASILAMHHAIDNLKARPELLLIDGNRFKKYKDIPHQCIIKGDGKYLSIAAASILAKTYRDDHMNGLHDQFPQYNWKKNKAYGTAEHRAAIEKYGITDHHRKSFRLLPDQLKIKF